MGTVDANNKSQLLRRQIALLTLSSEFVKFDSQDYLKHISEHVKNDYSKLPYLTAVGWKGQLLVQTAAVPCWSTWTLERFKWYGDASGTSGVRRNVQSLRSQTSAQHLAFHWARLIELLYACEHTLQLAKDQKSQAQTSATNQANPARRGIVEARGAHLSPLQA